MTCHDVQVFSPSQCTRVIFLVLAIHFLFHRITVIYYQHSRFQHKSFMTTFISIFVMRAVDRILLFVIFSVFCFEWTSPHVLLTSWQFHFLRVNFEPLHILLPLSWQDVTIVFFNFILSFLLCSSSILFYSLYLSAYSYLSLLLFSLHSSSLLLILLHWNLTPNLCSTWQPAKQRN